VKHGGGGRRYRNKDPKAEPRVHLFQLSLPQRGLYMVPSQVLYFPMIPARCPLGITGKKSNGGSRGEHYALL